jgi:hypothetical protein
MQFVCNINMLQIGGFVTHKTSYSVTRISTARSEQGRIFPARLDGRRLRAMSAIRSEAAAGVAKRRGSCGPMLLKKGS